MAQTLKFNHTFDTEATRKTAERRVHELSKPGAPMTMTAYINALITADGLKHPSPKKKK